MNRDYNVILDSMRFQSQQLFDFETKKQNDLQSSLRFNFPDADFSDFMENNKCFPRTTTRFFLEKKTGYIYEYHHERDFNKWLRFIDPEMREQYFDESTK